MEDRTIVIHVGKLKLRARLHDTRCARAIWEALPIEAAFARWGDEFYFPIPVKLGLDEKATTDVAVGDIGYWPPGQALAIFFGPTPLSDGERPVPASAVNLVGRVLGDARRLSKVGGTRRIRLERATTGRRGQARRRAG